MKTAVVFNIQRFSIHDGPGIRTTVFFKGCPLNCKWCANPESRKSSPQISVIQNNCIGCGACIAACANGARSAGAGGFRFDRDLCKNCGECADECYARAIKLMGREVTTEDVFAEIAKDDAFYLNSDGGYTLSGGEPLFYADFCIELTGLCADAGYGGVIETSGYGDTDKFVELCRRLDLVFFDIKHTDDAEHKKLTGVSNKLILDNLRAIQSVAKEIIIRTPLIPGMNDDESNIRETAKLCARLDKVSSWEILPYHRLGEHKYESLGKEYSLMGVVPPDKKQVEKYREIGDSILGSKGKICVVNTSAAG